MIGLLINQPQCKNVQAVSTTIWRCTPLALRTGLPFLAGVPISLYAGNKTALQGQNKQKTQCSVVSPSVHPVLLAQFYCDHVGPTGQSDCFDEPLYLVDTVKSCKYNCSKSSSFPCKCAKCNQWLSTQTCRSKDFLANVPLHVQLVPIPCLVQFKTSPLSAAADAAS